MIRFRFRSDSAQNADGFYFDDLKVTVIAASPLSITNNELEKLQIVPNPVKNFINLTSIEGLENYKIFNISGQLVASNKTLTNKIDVNFLSNGIYFLELSNGIKTKSLKFVVEK